MLLWKKKTKSLYHLEGGVAWCCWCRWQIMKQVQNVKTFSAVHANAVLLLNILTSLVTGIPQLLTISPILLSSNSVLSNYTWRGDSEELGINFPLTKNMSTNKLSTIIEIIYSDISHFWKQGNEDGRNCLWNSSYFMPFQ